MMTDKAVMNQLNVILESDAAGWLGELEYVREHGLREESEWCHTVHNTVYDIRNKKIWVTMHEWYDQVNVERVRPYIPYHNNDSAGASCSGRIL